MKFIILLVALFAAAFAQDCEFQCTANYEPVCATNGMTFSNECVLQREACVAKMTLTVAKQGECPSFCPEMCTQNYEPVCASNGKTFSNYCLLLKEVCSSSSSSSSSSLAVAHLGACSTAAPSPCPEMCPMLYQPVCGSNKLTYSNICMLEREACLTKTPIFVDYQGECAPQTPALPCPELCIEVYDPVCASNGRTFSNECFLEREACLTKTELTVSKKGRCTFPCPDLCPANYEPVCASNGVSYNNYCELIRTACTTGQDALTVSHLGACAPISTCPEACTSEYNPVCGTDDVTYSNPCSLTKKACELKKGITVAYEGECRAPCPEFCPAIFSPVCASNGRTYSNECGLRAEACKLKTDISVLHEGECAEADCPKGCPKDYNPVCASDGKTYGNLCSLNREACLTKAALTVVSLGECVEPCPQVCPLIYAPVCGSNWKTYSNECALRAEACNLKTEISVRATTECESVGCSMRCSKELKPICGSDGVTYGNECMMLLASCEKRRTLTKLHEGSCVAEDCNMMCPMIFEPLCGTNHVTFSSLCHYDAANCQSLQAANYQTIGIAHQGECAQLTVDMPLTWEILREYDTNNDGVISFEEYAVLAAIVTPYASEKLNKKVFDAYDLNGDGVLDQEEAKQMNNTGIHATKEEGGSNVAIAITATIFALVVVAIIVVAVVMVRKRQAARSFAPLEEQPSPYRPMTN